MLVQTLPSSAYLFKVPLLKDKFALIGQLSLA